MRTPSSSEGGRPYAIYRLSATYPPVQSRNHRRKTAKGSTRSAAATGLLRHQACHDTADDAASAVSRQNNKIKRLTAAKPAGREVRQGRRCLSSVKVCALDRPQRASDAGGLNTRSSYKEVYSADIAATTRNRLFSAYTLADLPDRPRRVILAACGRDMERGG